MNLIEQFWRAADGAPLVVLTDFDYTISQVDVGNLITDTFSPPAPETLARYRSGEIGTRLYWLDSMVRADPRRAADLAATVAIDPHFPAFAAWCQREGIPLAIVSDGFSFYIERILTREGLAHLPVFSNEMPETGRLGFPNANPVCDRCGCCKAAVTRRLRSAGTRVIFCGDGTSDLYASGFADWIFAKGRLARYLERDGIPFFHLDSFATVQEILARDLSGFQSGTARGRSSMQPHRFCRF